MIEFGFICEPSPPVRLVVLFAVIATAFCEYALRLLYPSYQSCIHPPGVAKQELKADLSAVLRLFLFISSVLFPRLLGQAVDI